MSNASVDLPEPETPVMTLNLPRGMLTERLLRLCSRALMIWMLLPVASLASTRALDPRKDEDARYLKLASSASGTPMPNELA